jgi:hypothetical protein
MTLMDAPTYDVAGAVLRRRIVFGTVFTIGFLIVGWWIFCGAPKDWPWLWNIHRKGTVTVQRFMKAVEADDLSKAYGIWRNDPDWQAKHDEEEHYDFKRFQQDWGPNGVSNEYGIIKSHEIPAQRVYGNVLVIGVLMNGRKSAPIFFSYDPASGQLGYSSVELYMGP